jgi:2,3-bisphosphoglycerate-dependent phosphoglycerate mutase
VRLFVIARHAESTLNERSLVNGDPSVPVGLTERGREESALLGLQVANIPLQACFHTRFARTRDTARIALRGRDVELHEEPLLDDIDVGELEGKSIADYRTWKRAHTRDDRFPGGESLNDAARRYAEGFTRVLATPHEHVLVVCHEIPLRYALNTAAGSDQLDGPVRNLENARPFLFSEEALARAAELIAELAA